MSIRSIASSVSLQGRPHLQTPARKFSLKLQLHRSEQPEKQQQHQQLQTCRRRRDLLLSLVSFPALFYHSPSPATAFSIGLSGPKEWLRDQKKKSAKYVLAPIDASRRSLRNAYFLLDSPETVEDSEEVRRLLNLAARDCVPQDRSSVVSFQASTGVEVCTFSLILKNAASLLDDGDPIKLKAEDQLGKLIRSFSSLSGVVNNDNFQLVSDGQKVKDGLMDTIARLDKFEQTIKDCLGM